MRLSPKCFTNAATALSNNKFMTDPARSRIRRAARRLGEVLVVLTVLAGAYCAVTSYRYEVPVSEAAKGAARDLVLSTIHLGVSAYDPYAPKPVATGPEAEGELAGCLPVEQVFPSGQVVATPDGGRVTVLAVRNEPIVRGAYPFSYQSYDEPRLHELRTKYRLDAVAASADDEFGGMVALRCWARSQFRRADYQPLTANFDALEVLDRNLRNHGEPYSRERHIDPCHFFPLLYSQVLLSVGHQARLMSVDHGVLEVWSNQYRKWVFMDPELNHHIEKDGVPLNMVEVFEENYEPKPTRARVVRGRQTSDENTTMVHLNKQEIPVEDLITWFHRPIDLNDLRNDWMTNHYFRGHPARSEFNSLTYADRRVAHIDRYARRLRPKTSDKHDLYWTLNGVHIRCRPSPGRSLTLLFDTVTPNFKCFECVVDGVAVESPSASFRWDLHDGTNTLRVRPVNRFGVKGIESAIDLVVSPPDR